MLNSEKCGTHTVYQYLMRAELKKSNLS